ncbi:MAG: hypothetical protein RSC30_01470 [Oscillospiraceae bacterium]
MAETLIEGQQLISDGEQQKETQKTTRIRISGDYRIENSDKKAMFIVSTIIKSTIRVL